MPDQRNPKRAGSDGADGSDGAGDKRRTRLLKKAWKVNKQRYQTPSFVAVVEFVKGLVTVLFFQIVIGAVRRFISVYLWYAASRVVRFYITPWMCAQN